MYVGIPVPMPCISVSFSASIPVSVSFSVLESLPVPLSLSAVAAVVVVVILCRAFLPVLGPRRNMRVKPVRPVAFVVLLLVVFPGVWLLVPTVMLVMVVVVMLVVAVVMVVCVTPVVMSRLFLVRHPFHHVLPVFVQMLVGRPLSVIPPRLHLQARGCLVVLGVAVMLRPAVVVVMVMGVRGSLWFSPREPLFLLFLALLSPLFLC